jgi:hypothetical protein
MQDDSIFTPSTNFDNVISCKVVAEILAMELRQVYSQALATLLFTFPRLLMQEPLIVKTSVTQCLVISLMIRECSAEQGLWIPILKKRQ